MCIAIGIVALAQGWPIARRNSRAAKYEKYVRLKSRKKHATKYVKIKKKYLFKYYKFKILYFFLLTVKLKLAFNNYYIFNYIFLNKYLKRFFFILLKIFNVLRRKT